MRRAVCESYSKAFVYGALNKIVMDQRKNMKAGAAVSYLGTLRAAEYGNRIRMTAFHAMQGVESTFCQFLKNKW